MIGPCLARRLLHRSAMAWFQLAEAAPARTPVSPNRRTSLALSWSTSRLRYHRARRRRRSRKMSSKICWEYADQVMLTASVVTSTRAATHHDHVASTTRAARPQSRRPTTCQVRLHPLEVLLVDLLDRTVDGLPDVGVLEVLDAVRPRGERGDPLEQQRRGPALLDDADQVGESPCTRAGARGRPG